MTQNCKNTKWFYVFLNENVVSVEKVEKDKQTLFLIEKVFFN